MLLAGRVNAVISKKHVASPVLAERFTAGERAKVNSVPVTQTRPTYDYLLISRKSRHGEYFLRALNRGLDKLHKSGAFQRLMDDLAHGVYAK